MPILNYTTTVAAAKTQAEISILLVRNGATRISSVYNSAAETTGMTFEINTPHGQREFSLPVDIEGVHAALKADGETSQKQKTRQHAEKVAWRIIKSWILTQLALIEARMATLDEVMFPYMLDVRRERTVYEAYVAQGNAELEG